MSAKTVSFNYRPLLSLGAASLLAGLIGMAPAHAANRLMPSGSPASSQQASASHLSARLIAPVITVADNDGDSDTSNSASAMKEKKSKRTNQATGAAGNNPGSMSAQKGNQPKSAVKKN